MTPLAMKSAESRMNCVSKPAAAKRNPSRMKMTIQTAATFSLNGTRALA